MRSPKESSRQFDRFRSYVSDHLALWSILLVLAVAATVPAVLAAAKAARERDSVATSVDSKVFVEPAIQPPGALGTTFTVNTLGDAADTNTADNLCDSDAAPNQQCTLRAAIEQANTTAGTDTISFDLPGAGPHTIQLDSQLPSLAESVNITNTSGESVTVRGEGATDPYHIFVISGEQTISISGLTLTNGSANVPGNPTSLGGGIYNNGSTLTLTNCIVSGNTAQVGGGIFNTGTLTLTNSTVSGNSSDNGNGGGIANNGGTLNLTNSTVSGNSSGSGGGISNSGTLNLTNSTISGNTTTDGSGGSGFSAGSGGGIYNSGTVTISNSTINGNTTGAGGDSVIDTRGGDGGFGGGIYTSGTVTITNTTISGNKTGNGGSGGVGGDGGHGGGIYNDSGTFTISNSTISGNTTGTGGSGRLAGSGGFGGGINRNDGTITLRSTIVAGNSATSGPDVYGTVQSDGFNLIQNPSGATINQNPGAGPDITGVDPQLGPLANNGGPTQTHALQCTSKAIDKGNSFGQTTDQRGSGFTRPFDLADAFYPNELGGDGTDIGAVETQTSAGCVPTLGNYPNTTVSLSGETTITPDAAPTNATAGINVKTSTDFRGTFAADPTTGVVKVTNAHPAGIYTVTVTALSVGASTSKTFQLTVEQGTACTGVLTFTNAADVVADNAPGQMAIGDFNADGKQDIAVANNVSNNVSIRLGDGTGGFVGSTNVGVGTNPARVAIGDFNSDGKQDMAVANSGSNDVSILLGDGTGSFAGPTSVGAGANPLSVAVGDFNNDGKQDLAIANRGSNNVYIRLGDGTGSFSGSTSVGVGVNPNSVVVGDFNNDGKQDIATSNASLAAVPHSLSIRLGDGAGNFSGTTEVSAGSDSANPISLAVGDFNNDGNQDFAATGGGGYISIFLGNGAGNFSGTTPVTISEGRLAVTVGDFNNDGKQDIAAVSLSFVAIRLGDGAGGFSGTTNVPVATGGTAVAIGDFNNDGKQDFASSNGNAPGKTTVSIRLGGCNSAPTITAATGLSRQQGSPVTNSQIATVTDDDGNGNVTPTVTSANPSNGVTISNIVNTGGNITADIIADCNASNASFALQASDGLSTATATLNVGVTANTAPVLTYNSPQTASFNGSLTVTPTAASDNGTVTYQVLTGHGLTTAPTVNSSGVVFITNAQPPGAHVITVRATDNCGLMTEAGFTLNVASPANVSGTKTKAGGNIPGQTVTYTVVLSNSGPAAQLDNPGNEFTDVLPSALTLVSASATNGTATTAANTVNWNGSIALSSSVTITITATINNVPDGTIVSNQGTINYDADGNGTNEASRLTDDPAVGGASDPTSFAVVSKPDLTITKTHGGNFSGGQIGASYTITVNNIGTGVTSGLVTVTDTVPVGLTPTGPNGVVNGWTCSINGQTLTCTRSDVLAGGGASYPPINLTVNVANPAPLNVVNTATVSGGGEVNTANNTASDSTAINCSANFALNNTSPLMISRFRENGPAGPQDEFVEIYNPSPLPHTVASGNCNGGGYGVYASAGNGTTADTATLVCYIPNGTVIPAGGYYLCTGVTYSLNNLGLNGGAAGATATGDAPIGCGGTCGTNIPDDAGLVLTNKAAPTVTTPEGFGAVEFGEVIYDKVGFGPYGPAAPAPGYPSLSSSYCEGGATGCLKPVGDASTGAPCTNPTLQFPVVSAPPACYGLAGQYEFLRRQTTFSSTEGTIHQDTNSNGNDFILVAPNPATNMGTAVTGVTGVSAVLGAAGPYNRNAPPDMPAVKLTRSPFDGPDQLGPRNAERRFIPDPTIADLANNPLGTLVLRFKFTNNSGLPINEIRFSVDNLSTLCGPQTASPTTASVGTGDAQNVGSTPGCGTGSFTAIFKALNSTAETLVDGGGTAQFVNGTVMEDLSVGAAPGAGPLSPKGGGIDSTFIINPSSNTATVGDGVTGGFGNFATTIGTTDPTKLIRVRVKFGVVRSGRFILLLVPMAKNSPAP